MKGETQEATTSLLAILQCNRMLTIETASLTEEIDRLLQLIYSPFYMVNQLTIAKF